MKHMETIFACPISCRNCRMSSLCIPMSLRSDELYKLDQIILRGKPLQVRQSIFRAGDPFTSIYAVRSGSVKAFRLDDDGREQVVAFYLPGEIFGWDGLADSHYQNTAVALETTSVCEIPFEQLDHLASSITSIQNYTTKLMSREIINGQRLIALLAGNSAHQRLASLLISLSDRLALQKLSSTRFRLPMSRGDISNYLGLTVETVSRTFSYFQKMGYLRVNKKEVELLNLDALQEVIADSDVFA